MQGDLAQVQTLHPLNLLASLRPHALCCSRNERISLSKQDGGCLLKLIGSPEPTKVIDQLIHQNAGSSFSVSGCFRSVRASISG